MHETYKKWLEDHCPKVICGCGCGYEIIVKNHHKSNGIPKYINGHNRNGKHHSKDTIEKISKAKFGEKNPNFGKHLSEKTIEKMSIANTGKHRSEETRQKMSKAKEGKKNPMFGKHPSKETIKKMSGENHPRFNNWASKGEYCEKWTEEVREKTRNEFNRKCFICGKSEEEQMKEMKEKGKRQFRLSVHHIDADKEQGCNEKPFKLIPVCLKCHNKIHNHKIKVII